METANTPKPFTATAGGASASTGASAVCIGPPTDAAPSPGPTGGSTGDKARPGERAGQKLALSSVLGKIQELSENEQAEYLACESTIQMAYSGFVDTGLAFSVIRDKRLYRMEYGTFEEYCRGKWQYGRSYVNRLIAAAQVFAALVTNSHQKPEHELQIRPLVGLAPEQAQSAWARAVEKAGAGKVTARLVKAAVRELQGGGASAPVAARPRRNRAEERELVDRALGELLLLVSQRAAYDVLAARIEELHRRFRVLFGVESRRTQRTAR